MSEKETIDLSKFNGCDFKSVWNKITNGTPIITSIKILSYILAVIGSIVGVTVFLLSLMQSVQDIALKLLKLNKQVINKLI